MPFTQYFKSLQTNSQVDIQVEIPIDTSMFFENLTNDQLQCSMVNKLA